MVNCCVLSCRSDYRRYYDNITFHSTVETEQRGTMFKTVLSVMRFADDDNEISTNIIDLMNMAEVKVSMKPIKTPMFHLIVAVRIRKNANAMNKIFSINITTDGYNKQFLCQDDWLVVQIPPKKYASFLHKQNNVFLYTIKLNFVVNATMNEASSVRNKLYKELYEETEFTDFKLQAEDGTVSVHKSVLYIYSEMFRAMLRGQWKETGEGSIDMVGVTVQTLQHLKEYMYLGSVPNKGLEPLLHLARRCLMDELAARCIERLIANVKPETFDALVELAFQNNIPELIKGNVLRIPDDVVNGIAKSSF